LLFGKVISIFLKELDVFARNSIKDELASLDPLLRNVGGWVVRRARRARTDAHVVRVWAVASYVCVGGRVKFLVLYSPLGLGDLYCT